MKEIISLTIKSGIRKTIDQVRGDIPRSRYINNILERFVKEARNRDLAHSNNLENKNQKQSKVEEEERL
jgi:hypothetical protein